MAIAGNCLIATGGKPDILAAAPTYPCYLPDGETEFEVNLLPFGKRFLDQGLAIEAPKPASSFRAALGSHRITRRRPTLGLGDRYVTIGEFYDAIIAGIDDLVGKLGEAAVFPNGGNVGQQVKTFNVTIPDSKTAKALLTDIIEEGEGETKSLWDERGKLAHYYVFQEMSLGRAYQPGDAPGKPTGAPIPMPSADQVYPMKSNPKMEDFPNPSQVFMDAAAFNTDYTALVKALHAAFSGQPGAIGAAIEQMDALPGGASKVLGDTIPDKPGVVPGPTFELAK